MVWSAFDDQQQVQLQTHNQPIMLGGQAWSAFGNETQVAVQQEPEQAENWLKTQTVSRIRRGLPLLCFVVGDRGSGKSRWAKYYAEKIVEWEHEIGKLVLKDWGQGRREEYDLRKVNFNIENIMFDPTEALPRLDLPPDNPFVNGFGDLWGTPEVIDEPIGVDAWTWQSEVAQVLGRTETAGRINGKHLFINSPHYTDIAARLRSLEPIVIKMWERGCCTFYKFAETFESTIYIKIGSIGFDPVTGERAPVMLSEKGDDLDFEMEKKKHIAFHNLILNQKLDLEAVAGTLTRTGRMRGATVYTAPEKREELRLQAEDRKQELKRRAKESMGVELSDSDVEALARQIDESENQPRRKKRKVPEYPMPDDSFNVRPANEEETL